MPNANEKDGDYGEERRAPETSQGVTDVVQDGHNKLLLDVRREVRLGSGEI